MFDDEKKSKFVDAISRMLSVQMAVVPDHAIEDSTGRINRQALGYIYGFIDCALRSIRQDMADVSLGVPITYQVLRHLFPGHKQAYTSFLIDHAHDKDVVLGMMTGGQEYADFNKPASKRVPMGLVKLIRTGQK